MPLEYVPLHRIPAAAASPLPGRCLAAAAASPLPLPRRCRCRRRCCSLPHTAVAPRRRPLLQDKPINPATGKKPLFSKVVTKAKASVKQANSVKVQGMDRY